MTSVAVLTNCYREEKFIGGCVQQFQPFALRHIVLNSRTSWNEETAPRDKTEEIASSLGAEVVVGNWEAEATQFNYGLSLLKNYDWVIICDSDERYKYFDIEILLNHLKNISPDYEGIRTNDWSVYWKTPDYELMPPQPFHPLIAVRPSVLFNKARDAGLISIDFVSSKMYHFSYVRTDEEMWIKISNFSHRDEFDIEKWYRQKWIKWTPEMEDLHPVVPEQFKKAIYKPCPDEIKALIPYEHFRYHTSLYWP